LIISACIVDSLPISLPGGDYFRFGGSFGRYVVRRDFSNDETQVFTNVVSPGQFDALRIPFIEGRDFNDADRANSPKVGIVNAAMALRLWSNESPVGRTIRGEDGGLIEIIGVAANIRYQDDERRVAPLLYRPLAQYTQVRGYLPNTLVIRTADEPLRAVGTVQTAVTAIDPTLLAYNMHTLEDRLGRTLLPLRVFAYIAGVPGVFALLLGLVGTYGTIALVVAQRRREIGIRIALGAHPSRAVRLITTEGMRWTAVGLCLGILGALFIALWLNRNFMV